MDLEQLSQQMPKPLLAVVVIFLAILLFFIMSPPHTICDAQKENLKENQKGILFPTTVQKRTYPGRIQKAMESCRFGNSSGACYEYFNILRRVALAVKNGNSECIGDMLSVSIEKYAKMETYESVTEAGGVREELSQVNYSTVPLRQVFEEGAEMMVRKAWGEEPPEPGPLRFRWLQESELAVYCHLQDVLRRSKTADDWARWQRSIMDKLPGEKRPEPSGYEAPVQPRPAPHVMSEAEIRRRSLFSVACGNYR